MPDIRMPDGKVVRFPDTMTETQIRGLIASKYPREVGAMGASKPMEDRETGGHYSFDGSNVEGYDPKTGRVAQPGDGYFPQGMSGANEGLANTLGFPIDMVNAGIGLGMRGINAVAGTDLQPAEKPFLGSGFIKDMMGPAIKPPTDERGKQFVRRAMQSVGASAIPAGAVAASAAAPITAAGNVLLSGLGGGAAAATSREIFPDNPTAEMIAELVGSMGTAAATQYLKKLSADKAVRATVPTVEKLKEQASGFYDEAEKLGVSAKQPQTQQLATEMKHIAADEGLISPTGRVSEAYPKAKEAIRLFEDYAAGEMSVPQMKAVRKVLSDAAGSVDDAERRVASIMLDKFDDFTSPLAPQLQRARQLYHAAKKGETLDTMNELAGSRAGQFTGSGFENARRTEFRGLERKIIKGQERGWSEAEQKAISKVAQGTPGSNAARNLGRMAPTGPVSFMSTVGIPYAIGDAVGGPAMGATAATAASGIGYGARGIANSMGSKAARDASLLVRNMGSVPATQIDMETLRQLIAAAAAATAANSANPQSR